MSETNGHVRTPARRSELAEKRRANRLLVEQIRNRRLERIDLIESRRSRLVESMSIDWISPYLDLLDRYRRDPAFAGPATYWQRRKGRNYPIFQSEQELALLRQPARILCATNSYAIGLLEGLTSYVIGPGFTYRAAKKKRERQPDEEAVIDKLAASCQEQIDRFLEESEWYGGEQPGLEEELFGRSVEDGEFLLCHYGRSDGGTDVRTAEPEQLICPPGESTAGDYSFGILTEKDDVQKPLKYYLQHGDTPTDGEEYDPDEVTHFRRNVKRSIKRGLTDFSFSTLDALELADRLRTNLGDAAAQQASIVGVRQHAAGTENEIQSFVDADKDFDEHDPMTGNSVPARRYRRGGWEDMPEGMNYVAGPIAQSQPIHLQVLQGLLRSAGVRWNAPEWLGSGDASNSNYAGQLVAESPFVRTIVRRQRSYKSAFARTMWVVIENAAKAGCIRAGGRAWSIEEIRREIDVLAEATSPETRNKLQEAQQAAIEIPLRVDSPQRYAQSQGRDWDQITQDNEQYVAETGGMGNPLPLPGETRPQIGGPPRQALGESLRESLRELFEDLLEDRSGLVRTKVMDKNGVERTVYVSPDEAPKGSAGAHTSTGDDHTRSRMGKLLARVGEVATAVRQKVSGFVVRTYEKLQAKYGSTGAKLVLGGMVALSPVPIPGTSLIPIAIAEGVKRIGVLFGSKKESLQESETVLDDGELIGAVREALAAIYEAAGEKMPDIDKADEHAWLGGRKSVRESIEVQTPAPGLDLIETTEMEWNEDGLPTKKRKYFERREGTP